MDHSEFQPNPVLDSAQLLRIEAVHRGYLFQHLYAAQCLLSAGTLSARAVIVESDEDVEVRFAEKHVYVQVKYRQDVLAWSDIATTISRFEELREAHQEGGRGEEASFLIVSNAPPNNSLENRIAAEDWPTDVRIDWPDAPPKGRILPIPPKSLLEAIEITRSMAQSLPFGTLSPDTLVWKIAGIIMLAATGESPQRNHVFKVEELPSLFEQLLMQLQDLPAPPEHYRVQQDEPNITTSDRVRLIVGHSGAGKTSWLAQSAQHAVGTLVYLDVADMPGAGLAAAIVREIAGRLFSEGNQLGQILLPGASGHELLQELSRRLTNGGQSVIVALDNAHRLSSDDVKGVIDSGAGVQFVLLCRPEGQISTLENTLEITGEYLKGWAPDTVAAAAVDADCTADAAVCQRLIDLTGGLPLYVLSALSIARADYGGDLRKFCEELAGSAHTQELAQEVILGHVFDDLPDAAEEVANSLSLCDAPITREEAAAYVAGIGGPTNGAFFSALRLLLRRGLLQIFSGDKIKIHDAARVVGKDRINLLGSEQLKRHRSALHKLIQASLIEDWTPAKLSLFLRLSGEVGRLDMLVEMATDELFHEMGVWPEIEAFLERGASDLTLPPDLRIQALDGLALAGLKAGSDKTKMWLDQMDELIEQHGLDNEEVLRVEMKRMNFLAQNGDRAGAEHSIATLAEKVKNMPPGHRRVYEYNAAAAELALGDSASALARIQPLIKEYYKLIGLKPEAVMGRNAPDLRPLIRGEPFQVDDIKHLGDSLDVLARALDMEGKFSPLARIHALKFYDLARMPDSMFRVGQDLVDQFVKKHDFDGALNFMENILLPQIQQWKLADYLIPLRSQYAVVLAYCGRFDEAETEMDRLRAYESGLADVGRNELDTQRNLIARLRKSGPPKKWSPPPGLLESLANRFPIEAQIESESASPATFKKVGRNAPCPCGSGKKFKKCHGQ